MLFLRLALVVAIFLVANVLNYAAPGSYAASRVSGQAYGFGVGRPATAIPGAALVELPPEGGNVSDTSPGASFGVAGSVGSTSRIANNTTGNAGAGTVTSTASLGDGELLGGVVRVHEAQAVASASQSGGRATASVTYGSVVVAGLAYTNPAPNTRIELPGIGYVIINEQLVGGDGRETASVVARAARLVITERGIFDQPPGTELILAQAAAGVPDINATRAVSAPAAPTTTPVPWAPIPPNRPVDINLNGGDDNDNVDFDNGNDNGGGGGGVATATSTRSATSTPFGIAITVIVIQATATPTP